MNTHIPHRHRHALLKLRMVRQSWGLVSVSYLGILCLCRSLSTRLRFSLITQHLFLFASRQTLSHLLPHNTPPESLLHPPPSLLNCMKEKEKRNQSLGCQEKKTWTRTRTSELLSCQIQARLTEEKT